MNERKILEDLHAYLGGSSLHIFQGEPGANFTKVDSNRTNFNLSD